MKPFLSAFSLMAASWCTGLVHAQTTVLFQGFEASSPCNAWSYTFNSTSGVNAELARTGTQSALVGRAGASSVLTFATRDISALSGVSLEFYHAVKAGSAVGMDTREGVVFQVQLNGGAWTTIGQVTGFSDSNWTWATNPGGTTTASSGCVGGYTCPNPLVYNPPAGTSTIALRFVSVGNNASACSTFNTNFSAPNPSNFDRPDEGLFIDDVSLKTTTSPVPAIWMGTTSTDWNTCTNWLYGSVPTSTTPVLIDQRAVNDCVVSATNATAKSIGVSSNNATSRTLTISSSRTLAVVNDVSVARTVAGSETGITVSNGSFNCTNLSLSGSAAGARQGVFRNESALNTVLVRGNLLLGTGGLLDLQPASGTGGTLQIQGSYTNNDQATAFDEGGSTVQFQGSTVQNINTTGFEEQFNNIKLNKGSQDLTLNAPVQLLGALTWVGATNARIFSTSTQLFTMGPASSVTGAGSFRFVSGPVRKLGNADFTFPIGKGSAYRPAQVTSITNTNAGYSAEYFPASAQTTFGTNREATLHHVSDCEYWWLQRTDGADDAYFWLSWATPNSCGVTSLPEMRVAYWSGAQWVDRGNGGTTGNTTSGNVRTEDVQSAFGSFTLASSSAENPLPIQLLAFDAQAEGAVVECTWTTATERDNDHFTVERGTDDLAFDPIGTVPGAGNSSGMLHYGFTDARPLQGLAYYRLRQTDRDGHSTVSNAVPVVFTTRVELAIAADGTVQHDLGAGALYDVFGLDGRSLLSGPAGEGTFRLPVERLPLGMSLLRVTGGGRSRIVRFVR